MRTKLERAMEWADFLESDKTLIERGFTDTSSIEYQMNRNLLFQARRTIEDAFDRAEALAVEFSRKYGGPL